MNERFEPIPTYLNTTLCFTTSGIRRKSDCDNGRYRAN